MCPELPGDDCSFCGVAMKGTAHAITGTVHMPTPALHPYNEHSSSRLEYFCHFLWEALSEVANTIKC